MINSLILIASLLSVYMIAENKVQKHTAPTESSLLSFFETTGFILCLFCAAYALKTNMPIS